nr:hypothetical protein [Tanacetum cinerariifolium]
MTSKSSAEDSSSESSARPSFQEMVDVEDEVEDEVESSDRGTIKVGVDMVVGIDIRDSILMPDTGERLEQVEEGLQDMYDHVIEIPLQRIKDIETGQKELESRSIIVDGERASLLDQVASLEKSNMGLQDTMMIERVRANRFWRLVRFIESKLRKIRRFCYYDRMRSRRLETFTSWLLMRRPVLQMHSRKKTKAKTPMTAIMEIGKIEIVKMEMVEMEIKMRMIGLLDLLYESVHTKTYEVSTTKFQGNGRSCQGDK